MDLQELLQRLQRIGLNKNYLRNVYVTVLYIEYLEDMYAYLTNAEYQQGLVQILGNDYHFVSPALSDPNILVNLCKKFNADYALQAIMRDAMDYNALDGKPFFSPQIVNAKNQAQETQQRNTQFTAFCQKPRYNEYYNARISDNDILANFKITYCRTFQALPIVIDNYKRSIMLCCKRVIADKDKISRVFLSQGETLSCLSEIHSTGSDTHKYGQEVLILRFTKFPSKNCLLSARSFQIVYKPRDIEIDALICADSAFLDCLGNNILTLLDYLNIQIDNYNKTNQAHIRPLLTYKFLPIIYGSNPKSNIEDSYGYVEFLSYEDHDFNIERTNNPDVVSEFYISMGMLMAITSLFSICDIHKDNLRVHAYQPCLVDAENSLVNRCTHLSRIGFVQHNTISSLRGVAQNRLYNGRNLICPEDNTWYIETGFRIMSQIIYDLVNQNSLDAWFTRLQNVISRQVPIGTGAFVLKKREIYNYQNCTQPVTDIQTELDEHFINLEDETYTSWYNDTVAIVQTLEDFDAFLNSTDEYKAAFWQTKVDQIVIPTFLANNRNYILSEYQSLDVPSYYHRIYTQDLLNLTGNVVQVTPPNYVQQDHLTTFSRSMVSTVYFCYPDNLSPTQVIIQYQLRVDRNTFEKNIETFIQQLHDFLW